MDPHEITDIPAYNRANGLMWSGYAGCMVATGIVYLFDITMGVILLLLICIPGIAVLIIVHYLIHNRYRRKDPYQRDRR